MTQAKFELKNGRYVRVRPKVKHVEIHSTSRVKSQILRMKA